MCTHLMSCSALEMSSIEQSTQVAAESAIGEGDNTLGTCHSLSVYQGTKTRPSSCSVGHTMKWLRQWRSFCGGADA